MDVLIEYTIDIMELSTHSYIFIWPTAKEKSSALIY